MKFVDHNIPKLQRIDSPEGRLYQTPSGKRYPSVTSVVGSVHEDHIREWREKVGEQVANDISRRAADRGTLIHENCENYLQGKDLTFSMFQTDERRMFNNLLPVLNSIKEVHAMETPLYSDKLEVAGTVDLIAKLGDGDYYIIDWKTSSRYKSEDEITHYFMQCAAYSFMFYSHTGIAVSRVKIAMTTQEFGLLEFNQPTRDWLRRFIEIRDEYRTSRGI